MKFKLDKGILVISAIYLLLFLFMLPLRHFAFEDDFAYYHTVRNFLLSGELRISEWAAATLISHILWGSLFALLFGLTYKSLHLSTAVVFYFGLVSFYLILRELEFGQKKSTIFTLFLLAFPNLLRLTFSFMTDIPYLSLMLISILFGVKSLKTNKYSFVLLSTVFGNLAFLNRQIGIIWPVALAMAFVVKSVYLKKAYLKQLAFVLLPTALSFFAYKYWLSLGNQTNAQYLFIEVNFNNIMKRWYPLGTHLLRPTNEVYDEVMYRSSIYLIFLLSLLTPLLLVFKHNLSSVKKNIQPLLIGVAILVAIYAILATRAQTDYANWKILRYPNILPTPLNGYEPLWRKIWHILLVVAFPLWAYFIGTSVVKATQSIFSHKKKVNYVWYGYSNLAILSVSSMYILRAVYKEGTEALPYLYFVTLWALAAALIVFFLFFYNINNQKNAQVKNSLLIYFSLGTIMQLAATTLSFFAWQHYIIPFSPLIIIAIATTFKKELNLPRAYAILAVLLVFSLYSTKIDYDNSGIKWEIAERIVDKGIVKPTEVGISDWAWLPYFYHEESFERRIQEVGGDKYKIGQIHTWWDYPEYKYARQKLVFSNVMCDKTNDIEVAAVKQDIFAQNIFKKYNYCLQLSSGSSR